MGKTRLALEVASRVIDEFPDGVWLAELASVSEPDQVGSTVAQEIGRHDPLAETEAAERVPDRIGAAIGRSRMLLLLDNCEHVVGAAAELAADLLAVCQRLAVVATSRRSLGIPGERLIEVGSLDTPAGDDTSAVAASEAGRLFVERAEAVFPAFRLDDTTAPAVAQVCRRLEGMPLAIELAAARSRIFTAGQLAERLEEALGVLSGGHGPLERHHTMRAALVWSYELLSDAERALFRSLGVLRSSVILEAVEAVAPIAGNALSVLESLIDKSLVVVVDGLSPERRFGLLEVVRQFAAELLRSGGEYDDTARRHRDFFLTRVQTQLVIDVGYPAYAGMAAEVDNVRAAVEHSLQIFDNEAAIDLVCAANAWWRHLGLFGEELHLLDRALRAAETTGLSVRARSVGLTEAASAAIYLGRVNESSRFVDDAGALAAHHPENPEARASWAFQAAMLDYYGANGDPARGNHLMRESQALNDASGRTLAAAYALGGLIRAAIFHDEVDDPDVDRAITDGIERARKRGAPLAELTIRVLGSVAQLLKGRADTYGDCLDAFSDLDRLGSGWFPEMCAQLVGLAAELTDEPALAQQLTLRYIRSCRRTGIRLMLPCAIRTTARLATTELPEVALRLWGGAEQMEVVTGLRNLPLMVRLDGPIRQACADVLVAGTEKLVLEGAAWPVTHLTEAAEEALLMLRAEPAG